MTLLTDTDFAVNVAAFFADRAPMAAEEFDRSGAAATSLWDEAERLGFPLVAVPEEHGGSGGSVLDAMAMLVACGRNVVPLPMAETFVAGALLTAASMAVPAGPLSVVMPAPGETLRLVDGRVAGSGTVPWGRIATGVVAAVIGQDGTHHVLLLDPARLQMEPSTDVAGSPRDRVIVEGMAATQDHLGQVEHNPHDLMRWYGALARTAQTAGALDAITTTTCVYTGQRKQFGKRVASFQAVQAHLVALAQAAALVEVSMWRAAAASLERPAPFKIYAARALALEMSVAAVRAAHQAHGAMGMTREYPLQRLTRQLHAWRQDFGTARALTSSLGKSVSRAPSLAKVISDATTDLEVKWAQTLT